MLRRNIEIERKKMLSIENVKKIYGNGDGRVVALDGIDLKIEDGKFVSIVGASGSGKSTLLNLIGLLDTPSQGTICDDDLCISDLRGDAAADYRNRRLGYVFQAFYLEPSFTVAENVEMPLTIAGVKKDERRKRAAEIIARVGLSDKINSKVSQLSGGQKQRVSIARALVHSPQLILADEPTGNLDKNNGEAIVALLREISDEGKTVVMVTHNKEHALQTDLVVTIEDGKIVSIDNREIDHESR